jgi:type VI secretion system protein ImpC
MANSRDRYDVRLTAGDDPEPAEARPDDDVFRIAFLGDFSGRRERDPIAKRRPLIVDPDNFDSVLRRLNPEVEFQESRIPITDLDDFHPDRLWANLPAFDTFRDLRQRLGNPKTFGAAAKELMGELPPAPARPASGADLLAQMLGDEKPAPRKEKPVDDLQAFIQKAVQPYLVATEDPRAPELVARVDAAAAEVLRAILHDPKFRALEAAWRSVWLLLQRLETGPDLKIYLYDLRKEELAEEATYDLLIRRSDPFALLLGNYAFGADDCGLLTTLAGLARKAGAPWLAEADASLLGSPQWSAFRHTEAASWVGLALPRVMIRMPYGKDSEPCETFPFEEIQGSPDPRQMLYASPAVFCALLLAEARGQAREVSGLPLFVYKEDGEAAAFPLVELELTEDTAEALMDNGIMPVVGIRHTDQVRVLRFQSAAEPPAALPGRWAHLAT